VLFNGKSKKKMFGSVTFSKKSSGVNHEKINISFKKRTLSGRCLDKLEETNWSGDVRLNQAFFSQLNQKELFF